jgi:hypothetical protein
LFVLYQFPPYAGLVDDAHLVLLIASGLMGLLLLPAAIALDRRFRSRNSSSSGREVLKIKLMMLSVLLVLTGLSAFTMIRHVQFVPT